MKSKFELTTMKRMLDILTVDKDEFTIVDIMYNTFMNKKVVQDTMSLLSKYKFIKYLDKQVYQLENKHNNYLIVLTDEGKELKQELIQLFYHYQKVLDLFNSE